MSRVYECGCGVVQLVNSTMQDQWQKKKQTKKEAAAARRNKLDPDSELNRNAKEVMDERARSKRKLREVEDEDDEEDDEDDVEADDSYEEMDGVEAEKPGEGLKKQREESAKKQKEDTKPAVESTETPADDDNALSKKEQKRAAKREKKLEKKAAKKAQQPNAEDAPAPKKQKPNNNTKQPSPVPQDEDTASASEPQSPTFDDAGANNATEAASTTTSVSSTIPPSEKPKHIKLPADTTALRARLAAKIEALRAARKADGADGKPIRTRQELIESRRAKQEQRKQHKKEVRLQAKMEEERLREEALASNSPGIMSPAVELDENGSGFSFGRVAFADGSQMSHDMSYILNQGKKKGPSDAKTALLKVQNAKKRLQAMDEDQRNDISEKDAWLTARRRAEGEKIRNNESILKKTIKRKEAAKKKSGKEWGDRLKGVDQAQKDRQKKREDNLKKRRDDKMLGKAGKKKKSSGGAKKKSGGRPGFEGSLGVGGGKKKK